MNRLLPLVTWILVALAGAPAQTPLPLVDVEAGDWPRLRQHCAGLAEAARMHGLLDERGRKELQRLVARDPASPAGSAAGVQKVLDPFCLVGITINPESRVKVARGAAAARLVRGGDTFFLVKVQNDAGVTAALGVSGPQVRTGAKAGGGRWLDADVVREAPMAKRLLGGRLEYVVLRLRPHEGGKREATLKFDVGQGTQDLGFRAEVPVLFDVRNGKGQDP